MTTKERLLSLFETHKGIYLSGEEIAEKLSVSRTAVWKAVNNLKKSGYNIDAVRNKGYMLSENSDIISEQGIRRFIDSEYSFVDIKVYPVVTSTLSFVKDLAANGAREGLTIIAGSQTNGRGRMGRSFYSPSDTGIYMSLLLRPRNYSSSQAVKITTMAAVAACEAIEDVSENTAFIKWVNDIFINNKKVCGILTEASFGLENGMLDYAVLGIGFNVYPPEDGFPKDIENIAGTIFNERISDGKNKLAACFLNHFMKIYLSPECSDYTEKYRERSLVIGREINVHFSDNIKKAAIAKDVDADCRLIVEYPDGSLEKLSTGEISIRLKN